MTVREIILSLHNSGVEFAHIARFAGKSVEAVDSLLSQCRREGKIVRVMTMKPEEFFRQFPTAFRATAAEAEAARSGKREPVAKKYAKRLDWCSVVSAWNKDPNLERIARRFELDKNDLSTRLSRLRCLGVPLKKQATKLPRLSALIEAAKSALTQDELAELQKPRARRGRVMQLPSEQSVKEAQA